MVDCAIPAIVTFLLTKIDCLLSGGLQYLSGVREEVEFIERNLPQIREFYRSAVTRANLDPGTEHFLGKLREALFNAEDVLHGLLPHAAVVANNEGRLRSSIRKISGSFKSLNNAHRRNLASEIHAIKSDIKAILDGLPAHNIINELHDIALRDHREQAVHLQDQELELVGIDEPRKKLIGWLVDSDRVDTKLKLVSVYGAGGLGKTTLVKHIYDDTTVRSHFLLHFWITVSEPYQIFDLLADILQQFYAQIKQPVPEEDGIIKSNTKIVTAKVKELLKKYSYLLILDDVRDRDAWSRVKLVLPRSSNGRVILTTWSADVASASAQEFNGHDYPLQPLSLTDAKKLFFRRIFNEDSCPPDFEQISESILKKCERLPLAIVAISGVLFTKNKSVTDEWEMVDTSLGAEMGLRNGSEIQLMREILSLSYNMLPYNIKCCFLYFSIFPENYPIECSRLIRLWVAERFAEDIQERTAEEVAAQYLTKLVDIGLIQVVDRGSDGRIKTCRVHNVLHKISILKATDHNFAAIAKQHGANCAEPLRRLSIHNSLQHVQEMRISQLRSLFVFRLVDPLSKSFIRTLFSASLKILNVLDLKGAPLVEFPDDILKLSLLKYLSLGDTKVATIPHSIGKLKNLQVLDLKYSFVSILPPTILKLRKLRHLLVYRYKIEPYAHFKYKFGFQCPPKISELQSLQKLCFVEPDKDNMIMTELGRLQQLRRLGIIKLRETDGNALCSSIKKLTKLRALSITAAEETEIIDLQCEFSPKQLKRLYLTGCLANLPDWILAAHTLVKLFLKGSRLAQDPFEKLQHLPSLEHLELLQVYEGENVSFADGGFKKLRILGLDKFNKLTSIDVQEGAMPHLQKLFIQRCNMLKEVPSGIKFLTELKVLEFFEMPNELIMTLSKGEGRANVSHIPEVYSTYWRGDEGKWDIQALWERNDKESTASPSHFTKNHETELHSCWK